jgi:hypothetical protein
MDPGPGVFSRNCGPSLMVFVSITADQYRFRLPVEANSGILVLSMKFGSFNKKCSRRTFQSQ